MMSRRSFLEAAVWLAAAGSLAGCTSDGNAGVDAEVASEEACRMEHCISDPSFRRLADHLADLREQGKNG